MGRFPRQCVFAARKSHRPKKFPPVADGLAFGTSHRRGPANCASKFHDALHRGPWRATQR